MEADDVVGDEVTRWVLGGCELEEGKDGGGGSTMIIGSASSGSDESRSESGSSSSHASRGEEVRQVESGRCCREDVEREEEEDSGWEKRRELEILRTRVRLRDIFLAGLVDSVEEVVEREGRGWGEGMLVELEAEEGWKSKASDSSEGEKWEGLKAVEVVVNSPAETGRPPFCIAALPPPSWLSRGQVPCTTTADSPPPVLVAFLSFLRNLGSFEWWELLVVLDWEEAVVEVESVDWCEARVISEGGRAEEACWGLVGRETVWWFEVDEEDDVRDMDREDDVWACEDDMSWGERGLARKQRQGQSARGRLSIYQTSQTQGVGAERYIECMLTAEEM
jgi:hypothetical protein